MEETSFRILETLSREIGRNTSINALTEKISQSHGKAYYANIYNKLRQLEKENVVTLSKVGNTTLVSLNFKGYWVADMLTQIELVKKQNFLREHIEMQLLFYDIENSLNTIQEKPQKTSLDRFPLFVRSISAVRPEKYEKLNRVELLVLVRGQAMDLPDESYSRLVRYAIKLSQRSSAKVDVLILTEANFLGMLASSERNPAREMLADKITFFGPENFWHAIKVAVERDIPIQIDDRETIPSKMSEQDLVYNMARFGYKEFGSTVSKGEDFCVEYTISGMITQGDARRIEAVPILLAKNTVNYDLLTFLSEKFRFSGMLLQLFKVFAEITGEKKDLEDAKKTLEGMNVEAAQVDKRSIIEKMRLYNAT